MKALPPLRPLNPVPATPDERAMLHRNVDIACAWYGLSEESRAQAHRSAAANPGKAARCLGALVGSL